MASLVSIYILYTLIARWSYQKRSDKLLYKNGTIGLLTVWNLRHLAGIVLFFFLPFFLIKLPFEVINVGVYSIRSCISIIVIGYLLFNLSIINGINLPGPFRKIEMESEHYTGSIILRIIFLVAYEFFFRGVLLFTVASSKGQLIAACISTGLYTISHIGSSNKELIATIPFGFFLCWITFETTSLMPAILLHWLIALPAEIIASKKLVTSAKTK